MKYIINQIILIEKKNTNYKEGTYFLTQIHVLCNLIIILIIFIPTWYSNLI